MISKPAWLLIRIVSNMPLPTETAARVGWQGLHGNVTVTCVLTVRNDLGSQQCEQGACLTRRQRLSVSALVAGQVAPLEGRQVARLLCGGILPVPVSTRPLFETSLHVRLHARLQGRPQLAPAGRCAVALSNAFTIPATCFSIPAARSRTGSVSKVLGPARVNEK